MKLVDLNELKAEKEGKLTPKVLLEHALENSNEMEFAVVITRYKDGEIKIGWSDANHLNVLGILEASKQDVLVDMLEEK